MERLISPMRYFVVILTGLLSLRVTLDSME
jgi:hypothetical protein